MSKFAIFCTTTQLLPPLTHALWSFTHSFSWLTYLPHHLLENDGSAFIQTTEFQPISHYNHTVHVILIFFSHIFPIYFSKELLQKYPSSSSETQLPTNSFPFSIFSGTQTANRFITRSTNYFWMNKRKQLRINVQWTFPVLALSPTKLLVRLGRADPTFYF